MFNTYLEYIVFNILSFKFNSDLEWSWYIRYLNKDAEKIVASLYRSIKYLTFRAILYLYERQLRPKMVTWDQELHIPISRTCCWWNIFEPTDPFSKAKHRKPLLVLSLFPYKKVLRRTTWLSFNSSNLHDKIKTSNATYIVAENTFFYLRISLLRRKFQVHCGIDTQDDVIIVTCSSPGLTVMFSTYQHKPCLLFCNHLPRVALKPCSG